jgi:hypothetical protein
MVIVGSWPSVLTVSATKHSASSAEFTLLKFGWAARIRT